MTDLPTGDQLVVVFETATPQLLAREFSNDEYDRWWRARVERIHGFDPATGGALPDLIYAWSGAQAASPRLRGELDRPTLPVRTLTDQSGLG